MTQAQQAIAAAYDAFERQIKTIRLRKNLGDSRFDNYHQCYFACCHDVDDDDLVYVIKFQNRERDSFVWNYLCAGKLPGKRVKLETLPVFAQAHIVREYRQLFKSNSQFKLLLDYLCNEWQAKIGVEQWRKWNDIDEWQAE